jgi:hypothetical protein
MALSARLTKCESHIPVRLLSGWDRHGRDRVIVEFKSTNNAFQC